MYFFALGSAQQQLVSNLLVSESLLQFEGVKKVQRLGLVHCIKDWNPRCRLPAMLDVSASQEMQSYADSNMLDRT